MRRLLTLMCVSVLAGCPAGDDAQDDTSDGGVDGGVDGGDQVTGLALEWEARPAIPAMIEDTTLVQSMHFRLANLRLIGDAATVPVTRSELVWSSGVVPTRDVVEDAPAGLYSSLQGMIVGTGGLPAFEIRGTFEGQAFVLRDVTALPVAVTFDGGLNLIAGGGLVVEIRVDVDDLIDSVDFTLLPEDGEGTLVLGPGDPQLAGVRGAIAAAFEVSDD